MVAAGEAPIPQGSPCIVPSPVPRFLSRTTSHRRRRLLAVAAVGVAAAGAAFGVGALLGDDEADLERRTGERFLRAWERGDYAAMHAELSDVARRATPLAEFTNAYRRAARTGTAVAVTAGGVSRPDSGGRLVAPVAMRTRLFGTLRSRMVLPLSGEREASRIAWTHALTFPGRREGEALERETRLPARAALLARDGTPLAEGDGRGSPLGAIAASIVGRLGPAPPERVAELRALGFPADAPVGLSGLERVFDAQLAGRPGGVLRAGGRVLATAAPRRAGALRTTIDPEVQEAAVAALGDRLGGVAAVRPRTGEILALAGIAFSGLQPPGSTFKIITLAGALDAGIASMESSYPYETFTSLEGVEITNAHNESCGGSLRNAFALSCNSVFAPLGAKLGAERLVRTAEAFGFNRPLPIPGAATSTIPDAREIGDDLAVGSSAIGQGRVQATALQMAWVASTIAGRGRRPVLTLRAGQTHRRTRVLDVDVARQVGRAMIAVVNEGTGRPAAIPGVRVAGKTGTAELKDTTEECPEPAPGPTTTGPVPPCPAADDDPTDTDAWFAAYAPAGEPRVAVGVLLVRSGAGADTAAPAARQVLLAALKS